MTGSLQQERDNMRVQIDRIVCELLEKEHDPTVAETFFDYRQLTVARHFVNVGNSFGICQEEWRRNFTDEQRKKLVRVRLEIALESIRDMAERQLEKLNGCPERTSDEAPQPTPTDNDNQS